MVVVATETKNCDFSKIFAFSINFMKPFTKITVGMCIISIILVSSHSVVLKKIGKNVSAIMDLKLN